MIFIKVIGKMIKRMDMEKWYIQMELFMKDFGEMINHWKNKNSI